MQAVGMCSMVPLVLLNFDYIVGEFFVFRLKYFELDFDFEFCSSLVIMVSRDFMLVGTWFTSNFIMKCWS